MDDALEEKIKQIQRAIEKKTPNSNVSAGNDRELSGNTVTKSHLLSRSYYRFSLAEKRAMEAIISRLHPKRTDNETQGIELTADRYSKTYGVSLSNAYTELKKAGEGLSTCIITTANPDGKGYDREPLMIKSTYRETEGRVICTINPSIVPHLIGMKEKFASYPLIKSVNFSSTYTWRFYEIMVSWAKNKKFTNGLFVGWFKVSIEEIRLMLGVPESYNTSRFFKKVLDHVVLELKKKANVDVKIIRIKSGRSYTDLDVKFMEDTQLALSFEPDHNDQNPPSYTDEDLPPEALQG